MKSKFIYNLIYQFLQLLIPLILLPYVTRVLGPTNLGVYNYSLSVANYFLLFAMLGVNNYGCRSIALVNDDIIERSKKFWSIYAVQFISSLITIIAYITYVSLFVDEYQVIAIIQILFVFSGMFDINWFFFGMEKFKITVTRNMIIKLLTTASIFIFVKQADDLIIYTIIYTTGFFLSQSAVWLFLGKLVKFVKINFNDCVNHIKPIFVLFIPIVAISLYKYMDKIMLGSFSDYDQITFYTNIETIIAVPAIITVALGTISLPRLTSLYSKGEIQRSLYYIDISLQFTMFISCAFAFGLAAVSGTFIDLYLGNNYKECSSLLFLAFPTVLFQSWATIIRMQILIPRHYDKTYIVAVLSGGVSNFILNLILIPILDAKGAIIGTLFAEFVVAFIQSYSIRKKFPIKDYFKKNLIYLFAGTIMLIIVSVMEFYLSDTLISLIIMVGIGAVVYIGITYIFNWKKKTLLYNSVMQTIRKFCNLKGKDKNENKI